MNRVKAKKVKEETQNRLELLEYKYDFLTKDFLQRIKDNNLNADDMLKIIPVLQEDVFKLPNNIVGIKDVSIIENTPLSIGDVVVCKLQERFVVFHFKSAGTILYKDSIGNVIPLSIKAHLPLNVNVISNTVNDGTYNHLMPLSNIEKIVTAATSQFSSNDGFAKSENVESFREQLYLALNGLKLSNNINKALKHIENNESFKIEVRELIDVSLKYSKLSTLAKEYNVVLEEQMMLFESGKEMDNYEIEKARKALVDERKKTYFSDVEQVDGKINSDELRNKIEVNYPEESKHFKEMFYSLSDKVVDADYMKAIEMISKRLGIEYNKIKQFYLLVKAKPVQSNVIKTADSGSPKVTDQILDKFARPEPVKVYKNFNIRTCQELLKEIKLRNNLSNQDEAYLQIMYDKTMNIFNKSWKDKSTQAVNEWAKQKRGKLAKGDIFEVLAVCIRGHQIVSKGVITLRDAQILSALLFLSSKNGNFAEIATGEGKTVIISCLAVIKVLQGNHVDIITGNEVLANEGLNEMRNFYYLLDIHANTNNFDPTYKEGPRSCYAYDIVYGNIGNFQFDYLRHSFEDNNTRGRRRFDFLILDEVDSLTIDNGTYIAKLAQPFPGVECLRYVYIKIWTLLLKFEANMQAEIDEKLKAIANQGNNKTDQVIQEEYDTYFLESLNSIAETLKQKIKDAHPLDIPVIPHHLKRYAENMLDKWIDNAIYAKYHCHENEDYVIKKVKRMDQAVEEPTIIPVDYANTGVTLANTIWSNGLHQFVQLKHNVKLNSESLTASFISNLGYINLYKNNMYGMTGTLGSEAEQLFLSSIYTLKYMRVPTFKPKYFYELDGIVVRDVSWDNCVIMDAYLKVKQGRSVLIICETIADVHVLKRNLEALIVVEDACWIKSRYYYDETFANLVLRESVEPCEIIVATNIAGRGTDFKTTPKLEENGGLHVCVTFLPCNERVEQQAFGRTSRKGNSGTAQLIVRESNVTGTGFIINESTTMADIKAHRSAAELQKLTAMKNGKIKEVLFQDKLFQEFASTYTQFLRERKRIRGGIYLTLDLKETWAFWLRGKNFAGAEVTSTRVQSEYQEFLEIAGPILKGQISFNPYYAVKQADYFIKNDNYASAESAIKHALNLSKSNSMYPAYMKLFEVSILNGKAVLARFLKALKKIIFIYTKDETPAYKNAAITALENAINGLTMELQYIEAHILENTDFHHILIYDGNSKGLENNILVKHIMSRYYAIKTFEDHAKSLKQQLLESTRGVTFSGRIDNYLRELKPKTEDEKALKANISPDELTELDHTGISAIYSIREVYDVSNTVIIGAQVQIAAGLAILVLCFFFPPAFVVGGPAAGALIGEGLTDIVIDLIQQGDVDFNLDNYIRSKCVSYLISIITISFSLVAKAASILTVGMKAAQGLAKFLQKSPFLKIVFQRMAQFFQKYAQKFATKLVAVTASRVARSGVTLARSQAIKLALKHVGFATGVNLAGAFISEFVVSRSILAILNASTEKIQNTVRAIVNEKFTNKLQNVNKAELSGILEKLSKGTVGQLAWEILKDIVVGLTQACHSWKVKVVGLTLYSIVNGSEIGTYARRYCEAMLTLIEPKQAISNSTEQIENLKTLIVDYISEDIHKKLMALASSATHNLIVNPLMSRAIRRTMKKMSNEEQKPIDSKEPVSFKDISDAYKELGLGDGASPQEIKQAYRKLAIKYHPDSRQLPNSEKFIAIQRAKETLVTLHDYMKSAVARPSEGMSGKPTLALPESNDLPMAHRGNIETLSRRLGVYIMVIHEESGKRTNFGSDYGGDPVVVHYKPPRQGIPGHYFVPNAKTEIVPSAKNNCLYDSLALLLNERGRKTTAIALRLEATSLSFANVKYGAIKNTSEVFNNKYTHEIYQNIQKHILVGGAKRPFKSIPLVNGVKGKYPSGLIEIRPSPETNNIVDALDTALLQHVAKAKEDNIIAPKRLNNQRTGEMGLEMHADPKTAASLHIANFVPLASNGLKDTFMLGSIRVEFINHPKVLKFVTVSGTSPFFGSLVQDDKGPYTYRGNKYKAKPFEFNQDGYQFVHSGTVDLKQIYDLPTNKTKDLKRASDIQHSNEAIAGKVQSSCAAVKLLEEVASYMKKYKDKGKPLTVKGDIHLVEKYFFHDVKRESKLDIEDSCSRCKIILPQITGK